MRVLVLGATGAMGLPLVERLSQERSINIFATSRRKQPKAEGVTWLVGDAHNKHVITDMLRDARPDCVIDFLNYTTASFKEAIKIFASCECRYMFISSARVYAPSNDIMNESSPRLLELCEDKEYLHTDEYALAKARQEDILRISYANGYSIIRPSITYNSRRLQLTLFELQEWLGRAISGNSIVQPVDMGSILTTMTHGRDVAHAIARLVLSGEGVNETYNVCGPYFLSWDSVLSIYLKAIQTSVGIIPKVFAPDSGEAIARDIGRYDQYRFARGIDRRFSCAKLESVIGPIDWTPMEVGLAQCVSQYLLDDSIALSPDWKCSAYLDRMTGEWTKLKYFLSNKQKIAYIFERMGLNVSKMSNNLKIHH